MPPKDGPHPPQAQLDAMAKFVEGELDRYDRAQPRDPGRVVARRLNRSEYTNTVRDLLGIEFRATAEFPTDDLGFGFDNIGSVLTVSPVLMERMVENNDGAGVAQPPKTLGDLVVLINPAFEAARFEPLERLAATKSFPPETNCTLAVFTSTADWATGLAFPIGREVSTVFESYVNRQQAKADVIAVGHYAPYISYKLNLLDKNAKSKTMLVSTNEATPSDSADSILSMRDKIQRFSTQWVVTTNELTYDFTHCQLVPTTNCVHNDPVFNVAVAPAIIPNHDDIDRGVFIRFLAEFLFAFSSGGEN